MRPQIQLSTWNTQVTFVNSRSLLSRKEERRGMREGRGGKGGKEKEGRIQCFSVAFHCKHSQILSHPVNTCAFQLLSPQGSISLKNVFLECDALGTSGRRQWQPTPVLLPGESQGWRSLVGCSPWGCTESDTTEATWQQAAVS